MRGIYKVKSNLAHKLEAAELLEHSNNAPDYIEQAPLVTPGLQELPVPTGISRLEIVLIAVVALIIFSLLLLNVSSDYGLSTTSREVQDLNNQIQTTKIEIENLEQHVHELSRYERIYEIANKYGLELHEENIRNLSPGE